jgi:hypothetical protein
LATIASAQTRKIGHRSHSGSPATFAMMLEDDHLGNPPNSRYMPQVRLPDYRVDPFIARVRKHYEEVAKQTAPVEIPTMEPPKQQEEAEPAKPKATEQPQLETPTQKPKSAASKIAGQQQPTVAAPAFLTKRPKTSEVAAFSADKPAASSLSTLILLLGLGIGPCLLIATAWYASKRPVA